MREIWSVVNEILQFWYSEIVVHWRSSSFQAFKILVESLKLKFKIWVRYNQWLLWYSTFYFLRSSSIGGCLHFKNFKFWFGPQSLSSNFEEDPISGCWDIPFSIFWGNLLLEVVIYYRWSSFHFKQYSILVWSPKLKFKIWGRSDE